MRTNRGPFSPITGPESGYQGASRGGNRGVASSDSNMVVAHMRIIILTITATSDIGVKLCLGKYSDRGSCWARRDRGSRSAGRSGHPPAAQGSGACRSPADVLPAEPRCMGEPCIRRRRRCRWVPEHDRGDDEVEAGGTKLLAPRHCVGNPALFAGLVCRPCLKVQMTCARK